MGTLWFRGVVTRKFTDLRSTIRYPAVRGYIRKTCHRAFDVSNPSRIVIMAIRTLDSDVPERPCRISIAASVRPSGIDRRVDVKGNSKLITELSCAISARRRYRMIGRIS